MGNILKDIRLLWVIILLPLSCTEIPPIIGGPGQGSQEGEQRVLVEEFTGVYCVNCPGGSAFLQQLQQIYGDRMVIVSIHAGFFARQYPESQYQFKTDETEALQNLLGAPVAYPSATVNRMNFEGQSSRILGQADWASHIQESLDAEPLIALDMATVVDDSRNVTIDVQMTGLAPVSNPLYLTVMLTEDNITDPQNTLSGVELNYVHHHVLRKILTPVSGESLSSDLITGEQLFKTYSYGIPTDWDLDQVHAIAVVHRNDGILDVLNVVEKKVKE